jgi:hypothetical protein
MAQRHYAEPVPAWEQLHVSLLYLHNTACYSKHLVAVLRNSLCRQRHLWHGPVQEGIPSAVLISCCWMLFVVLAHHC